jgi:hypothetical protein
MLCEHHSPHGHRQSPEPNLSKHSFQVPIHSARDAQRSRPRRICPELIYLSWVQAGASRRPSSHDDLSTGPTYLSSGQFPLACNLSSTHDLPCTSPRLPIHLAPASTSAIYLASAWTSAI